MIQPIRVLIVEDDEDDFIIARDLFAEISRERYVVEWAESFERSLEIMARAEHDVYLIDYRLGAQSGLELLRLAQMTGHSAPFIFLTGQGDPDIDTQVMRAGAEDFLVKGEITPRQLERSVRYAIARKRADEKIQKLAAFPRCNPSPVLEFSADGKMSYCNDAALALAESLGKSALDSILPLSTAETVAECLAKNENKTLQTTMDKRTFSWRFVPILPSHVVHLYATETTERLNLEIQLRHSVKMDAVGQLAAGVAHDFNNILTIVQGHANLLLNSGRLDSDCEKPIRQICVASERASNLIRQLLMFSSKQVMQPRYLDLNEVIGNINRMLQRLLGEHILLECIAAPNLAAVYADAGMLEQAIINLAINSRDAMPRGGQLVISTDLAEFDERSVLRNSKRRPGKFVSLCVSDTGCGIETENISRIFEPFFTTKEVGKGTGLGLATVYGIVKQHEGWIDVETRVGAGTTFRIFFPSASRPAAAAAPERISELPVEGGTETILIVEDEPALRELVSDILKLYGYHVFTAGSGPEALRVWEQHKDQVDLLLTDMVMPEGLSGRELAEKLLRDNPRLKVIYTSGYSPGMAGRDIALLEGFNFLPKPYPPVKLAQLVRECLNVRPASARSASA